MLHMNLFVLDVILFMLVRLNTILKLGSTSIYLMTKKTYFQHLVGNDSRKSKCNKGCFKAIDFASSAFRPRTSQYQTSLFRLNLKDMLLIKWRKSKLNRN